MTMRLAAIVTALPAALVTVLPGALALSLTLPACGDDATQTTLTRAQLLDPQTCATCHPDHYADWSASMHAYASIDPVFLAMNRRGQRETQGTSSPLGKFCVNCHAPMALREGATTDGLNLAAVPKHLQGVTCFFCHTVQAVTDTHNNPLQLDPAGTTMRGEYADPVRNTAHRSTYSALHDRDRADSANLCGSCHDIVTPPGGAIERTFTEWHGSVFSSPGGATCGQCHMYQSLHDQPIARAPGVFARRFHGHDFPAVDVALDPSFPNAAAERQAVQNFLKTELQSALCVVDYRNGTGALRVILDNVAAGHNFPSGSAQDRRLFAEVIAYKNGAEIYHSGVVADGQPSTQAPDAAFWMLRDCMLDPAGTVVPMFWQAASYESNSLPAQATFNMQDPRYYQTHILQTYPRDPQARLSALPDRVTLRIRLEPIGLDVLDDLIQSRDLDPTVRAAMPRFDLDLGAGATLEWTAASAKLGWEEGQIYPVTCVTQSNLNFGATTVPAGGHVKCQP
jgi:hypothetical protein